MTRHAASRPAAIQRVAMSWVQIRLHARRAMLSTERAGPTNELAARKHWGRLGAVEASRLSN